MSVMAVLTHGSSSLRPPIPTPQSFNRGHLKHLSSFTVRHRVPHFFKPSIFRMRGFGHNNAENYEAARSRDTPDEQDRVADEVLGDLKNKTTGAGSSFLAKLAIALGIAATITVISVGLKQPVLGSSLGVQWLADGSSSSVSAEPLVGFTVKAFGYKVVLPECAPGWIYFWLLMAAGCGLFISEEALNIWVGISLARLLSLDGTWKSFAESFSRNAPYIISTILWVYWGVCISDMIPFYLGKLFRQTKASDDVCSKLGIGKEKALSISRIVQRYGNLIGFGLKGGFTTIYPYWPSLAAIQWSLLSVEHYEVKERDYCKIFVGGNSYRRGKWRICLNVICVKDWGSELGKRRVFEEGNDLYYR